MDGHRSSAWPPDRKVSARRKSGDGSAERKDHGGRIFRLTDRLPRDIAHPIAHRERAAKRITLRPTGMVHRQRFSLFQQHRQIGTLGSGGEPARQLAAQRIVPVPMARNRDQRSGIGARSLRRSGQRAGW